MGSASSTTESTALCRSRTSTGEPHDCDCDDPPTDDRPRTTLYRILSGLTSLAVILQGLWAGIFLEHDGSGKRRRAGSTCTPAAPTSRSRSDCLRPSTAFVQLPSRCDLWLGSGLLTSLLVAESSIGGLIRDDGKDTLTAVHVPLAMAVLALAVWLPPHAGRR
jgi:hypothetical protein